MRRVGDRATPAKGVVSAADRAMHADEFTRDARDAAELARGGVPFVWTIKVWPLAPIYAAIEGRRRRVNSFFSFFFYK